MNGLSLVQWLCSCLIWLMGKVGFSAHWCNGCPGGVCQEAALRFLKQAIRRNGVPETMTIDGSDANEAAIKSYKEEHGTTMVIRQVKYLNHVVEQDHRAVKRITRPMSGFKSVDAAQGTVAGIALMHMIKKRQLLREAGDESLTAAEQFYALAA